MLTSDNVFSEKVVKNISIGSMYGIFSYIYPKNHLNVAKYTSPMDPMG